MFHIFSETFLKRKIKIKNYQFLLKQSIKLLTVRDENYILRALSLLLAQQGIVRSLTETHNSMGFRVGKMKPEVLRDKHRSSLRYEPLWT